MNFHWKFCYNSELLYRPIKYNFLEILEIKIDWIVKDKITRWLIISNSFTNINTMIQVKICFKNRFILIYNKYLSFLNCETVFDTTGNHYIIKINWII